MAHATLTLPTGPLKTRTISHGDTVVSFRGVEYIFLGIERLPEPGRSGKVRVADPEDGAELVFYDMVFPGLTLEA
ncbi:hypothetical protein IXEL_28 [Microbacterium phage Ixel]|nr:hypothetical protein IXEL_28 [Microbacterium phage Ixel]